MQALRTRAGAIAAHPASQAILAEIQTTSSTGLVLFCAFPLILGICVMSNVAKRDTIQNSNVSQLLLTACLLFGFCVFGVLLHHTNGQGDTLMYTVLALCFFCVALLVGNGGIAVLLADSYNTVDQWIQAADK